MRRMRPARPIFNNVIQCRVKSSMRAESPPDSDQRAGQSAAWMTESTTMKQVGRRAERQTPEEDDRAVSLGGWIARNLENDSHVWIEILRLKALLPLSHLRTGQTRERKARVGKAGGTCAVGLVELPPPSGPARPPLLGHPLCLTG